MLISPRLENVRVSAGLWVVDPPPLPGGRSVDIDSTVPLPNRIQRDRVGNFLKELGGCPCEGDSAEPELDLDFDPIGDLAGLF